jgi:L-serine dehydratase
VYVSAFELYRIGPGPSSSALGPQRAALRFVHDLAAQGVLPRTARVEAELYGGLAFHGRERASDQAIVAGLAGLPPNDATARRWRRACPRGTERSLALDGRHPIPFSRRRFAPVVKR